MPPFFLVTLEHERKHLEFWDAGLRFADRELEDIIARVLSVARVNEMLHAPGSP